MAVAGRWSRGFEKAIARGFLEPIVIGLMGLCVIAAHLLITRDVPTFALDAVTMTAAALTGRWPRAAGIALALLLIPYFTFAVNWWTLAEYAPVLVIFCFGVRGRIPERRFFSVVYLVELWLAQLLSLPDGRSGFPYLIAWAVFIGFAWLFGSAWHGAIVGAEEARLRAALEERHELARELHDSVAASLSAVSLRAEQARLSGAAGPAELAAIADDAAVAVAQFGQIVNVLSRDSEETPVMAPVALEGLITNAVQRLAHKGFQPRLSWEGGHPLLPGQMAHTLGRVIEEATNNVLRHGSPASEVAVLVEVADTEVEVAFRNNLRRQRPTGSSLTSFGQTSMRERVTALGGTFLASPQGDAWLTTFQVPLPPATAEPR